MLYPEPIFLSATSKHSIMKRFFIFFSILLSIACSKSSYETSEAKPTLEVKSLQEVYRINEPIYLQISAAQKGYKGEYKLSIVLNDGSCEIKLNGEAVSANGEWVALPSSSEILTVTPLKTGTLKLSFEVTTEESASSGRSSINLKIEASPQLIFSVSCPETGSITGPVEIIMLANKDGFNGMIPIQFTQVSGSGTLQFGATTIPSAGKFSIPTGSNQTLYYTPSARGIHSLQFSATDGFSTEFKIIEIIITD